MHGSKILVGTILALAFSLPSLGQARGQLSVHDAAIGTYVADRKPYGTSTQFSSTVGQLYAFTHIVGADAGTRVTHKWYYGQQLMAEVQLRIGGDNWRTWSSKNVMSDWVGEWRVEVIAEDGTMLETITFEVG